MNGKKVALIVPSIDGKECSSLSHMNKIWTVMGLTGQSPHMLKGEPVVGQSPVEHARNMCVKAFFERYQDCDTLWMIDADTIPTLQSIYVLDSEADISIAPVPMFIATDDGMGLLSYNVFRKREDGSIGLWVEGAEAYCAGTACCAVSRKVLEDPRMVVGENPWEVFRTQRKLGGETIVGEDLDFMDRAISLGYSCNVVWQAKCDHLKPMGLHHYATSVLSEHGKQSPAYLELLEKTNAVTV